MRDLTTAIRDARHALRIGAINTLRTILLWPFGGVFQRVTTLENRMAQIDDDLAALRTALQSAQTSMDGISDDVASLKAIIEQLQSQIGAGLTPEQQALLTQARGLAEGLASRAAAIDALTAGVPPVA